MFSGCTLLDSIKIPSDVSFIGESAFENCGNLKTISIPNSVTNIYDYAFSGCSSLSKLILEDGDNELTLGSNHINRVYGQGLLYDCPIQELYVGRDLLYNSEKKYGYSPFYNKTELNNVIIGEQVTNIGINEFSGCSGLTTILLPKSITNIDDSAFAGCTNISSVVSLNTNPPTLLQNAFDDTVYNNAIAYVPASSMPSYQTAAGWQNFWKIKTLDNYDAVNAVNTDNSTSISLSEGVLHVVGDAPIRVVSINGGVIYNGKGDNNINLNKGMYIVVIGDKVSKVVSR
jgi:hypothetical protein